MNYDELKGRIDDACKEYEKGNFTGAEEMCTDVLALLPATKGADSDWELIQSLRSSALYRVARSMVRLGRHGEAMPFAQEAYVAAVEANSKADEANAYEAMGTIHKDQSLYQSSLDYFQESLRISTDIGYTDGTGRALNGIGSNYCDGFNDFGKALEAFEQSLSIFREVGNEYWSSTNYVCIATVYEQLGMYDKALQMSLESLDLAEKSASNYAIAFSLEHIGVVYRHLGSYENALEYYFQALAAYADIGNKVLIGDLLSGIALTYSLMGSYTQALEYASRCTSVYDEIGYIQGSVRQFETTGVIHFHLGNYALSLEHFSRALSVNETHGNKFSIAKHLGNVGEVYSIPQFEGFDAVKAEEYLWRGISMQEEIGSNPWDQYRALSELYHHQERWKESDTAYRKYIALEREVLNEQVRKKADYLEQQKKIAERDKEIAIAKARAEVEMNVTTELLHKVLPSSVASRLIKGEKVADYFSQVSILFADIVGFTPIASKMPARKVLAFLNYVFGEFDRIIEKYGCEKIKTIGDGYMAVAGAPIECSDHAERIARAAIEMMGDIQLPDDIRSSLPRGSTFSIRIGINSGPAFGGIVGENRFVYDIYSDAVNTAARMESLGEPNKIHVSEEFAFHLQNRMDMTHDDLGGIRFEEREETEIKGKGRMKTYFIDKTRLATA